MKCDYCGSEMSLNGNMYVCNDCFTTYIVKNEAIIKKYIVPDDFAEEYKKVRISLPRTIPNKN